MHKYSGIGAVWIWVFVLMTLSLRAQHPCALAKSQQATSSIAKISTTTDLLEDVVYLKANWELNPAARYISGTVLYRFKVLQMPYDTFRLDLSDSLEVTSVFCRGIETAFIHQEEKLRIALPTLSAGDTLSLSVEYRGVPTTSGFGSFNATQTPAGDPIIWTLSEPYGASDWWPAREGLTDKIDSSDFYISVPSGIRAACNGKLIDVDSSSGRWIFHWKHRYPIANYLIAVAVSNYVEIRREVPLREGNVEVLNYCYPVNQGEWEWQQTEVAAMFQYFDSLFTPYPFSSEKYGHAQFSWGGGMEHQTMSFMADLGPWLTSHELGHQWFGNSVTCGSWKDIWLNEGFATYLTGLFFARFNPPAFYYWRRNSRSEVVGFPDGSVIVNDTNSVSRIFDGRLSYYKGALVLHMLRRKLGDALFFSSIRAYLEDEQVKHGFAKTADLQRVIEAETQVELDTFFTEWIYGEGHPEILVKWRPVRDGALLHITQKGSTPASVSYFHTTLPVQFKSASDSLEVAINLDAPSVYQFVALPFQPDTLLPDHEAHYLATYEVIRANSDLPQLSDIAVFPNPFGDSFSLSLPEGVFPDAVQLFSSDGREVNIQYSLEKYTGLFQVNLLQPASGLYFMRLRFGGSYQTLPVVSYR